VDIPILGEEESDRLFDESKTPLEKKPDLPDPPKGGGTPGKAAAKGVGKSGAKMLPIIGTFIGLGLAAERAYAGDLSGAASELAGAVPVAGDVKDGVELTGALYAWWTAPPTGPAPTGKMLGTGEPVKNPRGQIPIPCPGTTQSPKPLPKPPPFAKTLEMMSNF
jgi:hypothetical protein